ncbi:DUF6691 family protein [Salinibius halmophilus]|uniref:DUF6691 family protein n=1 Tax=Salinibius halmophilus TaxID=1853216 RepID=UPI000E6643CA|nr:DUF6691 family protein [Salinibius halmophilus]
MKNLIALIAGVIFGFGLAVSKMLEPQKVIGFLDVTGQWDPTLGLVMVGALIVMTIAHQLSKDMRKPLYGEYFRFPTKQKIDAPLIAGAAIFGIGWGIGGFCPGPAITAAPLGNLPLLLGLMAYLLGVMLTMLTKQMLKPTAAA